MRVCVGAVLLKHSPTPEVLLVKRAPTREWWPGVWDVAGGHCAPGESMEQTLVREMEEELGISPTEWKLEAQLREAAPGVEEPYILHLYVVSAWIGTVYNRQPEEHSELGWFNIEDACRLDLPHPEYSVLFRQLTRATSARG